MINTIILFFKKDFLEWLPYLAVIGTIIYLIISLLIKSGEILQLDNKIQKLQQRNENLLTQMKQQKEECQSKIFEAENKCEWGNAVTDINVILQELTNDENIIDNNETNATEVRPDLSKPNPGTIKPGVYKL